MGFRAAAKKLLFRTTRVNDRLPRTAGNAVLLTFDDGPDPEVTPRVLDLLAEYGARGIFFVIGERAERYPELIRRTLAEGHLVGNHTYTHSRHGPLATTSYWREVTRCQRAVRRVAGVDPTLFRPPYGAFTVGSIISPWALRLATVYWSVDPKDFKLAGELEALACGRQVADLAAPGDVVLLHDVHPNLPPLLSTLLPGLRSRGFGLTAGVTGFRCMVAHG